MYRKRTKKTLIVCFGLVLQPCSFIYSAETLQKKYLIQALTDFFSRLTETNFVRLQFQNHV